MTKAADGKGFMDARGRFFVPFCLAGIQHAAFERRGNAEHQFNTSLLRQLYPGLQPVVLILRKHRQACARMGALIEEEYPAHGMPTGNGSAREGGRMAGPMTAYR